MILEKLIEKEAQRPKDVYMDKKKEATENIRSSESLQTQLQISWDLVEVLDGLDGLDVERLESVWRETGRDELSQFEEAVLEVTDLVASDSDHLLVVPQLDVQQLHRPLLFVEVGVRVILEDVDSQQSC